MLCLHRRLCSSCFRAKLDIIHRRTRREWPRISWRLCRGQHVSDPIPILPKLWTILKNGQLFSIVANTTSLKHRPIYTALSGGVECVALAFSPILSGAIARYSEWRITFYIVIPVGVIVILSVFFFVQPLQRPEHVDLSGREKLRRLDMPGLATFVPLAISVILALEWAGTEYSWNSWRIILLWSSTGVLLLAFLAVEYRTGENSMFPLKFMCQRSVALGAMYTFCNSAALFVIAYYVSLLSRRTITQVASRISHHHERNPDILTSIRLTHSKLPIYFQAIRNATAFESGLMYLPTAITFAPAVVIGGVLTAKIGYYTPIMVVGSILMVIATGLFTTFIPTTPSSQWIAYQILYGVGVGIAFQQPYTAVQTVLPDSAVATALVALSFTQEIGGIVALSVAQNMFLTRLTRGLAREVPGLDAKIILNSGALGIRNVVSAKDLDIVIGVYNDAVVGVFYLALGLTCLTVVGAVFIEWKSVKREKVKPARETKQNAQKREGQTQEGIELSE